jgi:hypothetical protein
MTHSIVYEMSQVALDPKQARLASCFPVRGQGLSPFPS